MPSLESYETTLRDIKQRLVSAGAQVALVSPPVLGEDINSEANRRAAEFAAVVRKAMATLKTSVLPVSLSTDRGRNYFPSWLYPFQACTLRALDISLQTVNPYMYDHVCIIHNTLDFLEEALAHVASGGRRGLHLPALIRDDLQRV